MNRHPTRPCGQSTMIHKPVNSNMHTFVQWRTGGPSTSTVNALDAAVETRDRCAGCGIGWSTTVKHQMRPVSLMAITCKSFAKHCTTAHDTKLHALQDLAHVQRDVVVSNLTLRHGPIEAIKFEKLACQAHVLP